MSAGRRFIGDLLHAGMQIPLVTIQKDMNVAEVVAARKNANPRPSWCSIFTKAYGKAVATHPQMRRAYLSFPWERIFEYTATSADITVEVRYGDETILAFVPIKHPEACPLLEIDRKLALAKENPLKRIARWRRGLRLAYFPRFIRRSIWWALLNTSSKLRAGNFGTFGVTSVGNWGVESIRPIAPVTSILHYGAIDPQGNISIRMTYDHRVLDGSGPSQALVAMEGFLKTDIVAELKSLEEGALKAA
jgi:pyruvate/2-oxoglutarate dehydrogenase complex dihydrolipoamide acyltransferase (E2) component